MAQGTAFYIESPIERLVNVHWGGGIIIAEVPDDISYLYTFEPAPADPDSGGTLESPYGTAEKIYDLGDTVPAVDYSGVLNTTGNTYATTLLDNLASTEGLTADKTYRISGTNIQPDTTFEFDGGSGGILSKTATGETVAGAVSIDRTRQFFLPRPSTGTDRLRQYYVEHDSGDGFPADPDILFQGTAADQVDFWNSLGAASHYRYFAAWFNVATLGAPLLTHNGVTLNPQVNTVGLAPIGDSNVRVAAVFQFIFPDAEDARSYIVNMAAVQTGAAIQLSGGAHNPAFEYDGGIVLKGYDANAKIVLEETTFTHDQFNGGSFEGTFFHLVVRDPDTDDIVDPIWEEVIFPDATAPAEETEIGRFDGNGLIDQEDG